MQPCYFLNKFYVFPLSFSFQFSSWTRWRVFHGSAVRPTSFQDKIEWKYKKRRLIAHSLPLSLSLLFTREIEMRGRVVTWLLLLLKLLLTLEIDGSQSVLHYSREDFPPDFVFGAGTSAYQVEGAAAEDGRSPCIWDTFTHAGKMLDKSTGDVASDGYHKYKEDVKLMTDTGLEAYRFSISWSRLLPNGRGALNPKGIEFYNNLIDELLKHGIQPHVTLYHLDLPQILQDEYGGWLSPKIVDDFTAYADVCFREFGDRVSHWTTITEPNVMAIASYDTGAFPPARCSYPFGINCMAGNSTTEPYIAVHNILLAHASVVKLYRTKYQAIQNGWIGLNVYTVWSYPLTNSAADVEAAQRTLDFMIGWIMNPLVFGDYPEVMKKNAGSRLPLFTKNQSKQVKGSFDFIGLNHYFSVYVCDNSNDSRTGLRDFNADILAKFTVSKNITPIGRIIPMRAPKDPRGLQYMLEYLKDAYENPPIYIQENGYGLGFFNDTLHDTARIDFLSGFIGSTLDAIRNGSDVRGYFVWSFLDVFEFLAGYTSRFGLYYVDFEDENRERMPKQSAFWYSNFLKKKNDIKIERTGIDAKSNAQQ